jgi:hypothetical protein
MASIIAVVLVLPLVPVMLTRRTAGLNFAMRRASSSLKAMMPSSAGVLRNGLSDQIVFGDPAVGRNDLVSERHSSYHHLTDGPAL